MSLLPFPLLPLFPFNPSPFYQFPIPLTPLQPTPIPYYFSTAHFPFPTPLQPISHSLFTKNLDSLYLTTYFHSLLTCSPFSIPYSPTAHAFPFPTPRQPIPYSPTTHSLFRYSLTSHFQFLITLQPIPFPILLQPNPIPIPYFLIPLTLLQVTKTHSLLFCNPFPFSKWQSPPFTLTAVSLTVVLR